MILLNKINYNNKLFQVFMDNNQNRLILEIKNDPKIYYMYPEIEDLINITKEYFSIDDVVYSNDKNNNKYIKIAQKVLISGVIVSIVLTVQIAAKPYSLQIGQKAYNSIVQILPNRITTPSELKEEFNTNTITKDDIHKAIDNNPNLNYYNSTIHKYVNDVYKKYPDHNWWIFYQNIKNMTINYDDNLINIDGSFNPKTSEILISKTLKNTSPQIVLRHELTHSLSLINKKIDDKNVKINFINNFSGYGRSVMELLTCGFNSYTGNYIDYSYEDYNFLFEPLINKIGKNKFYSNLFTGDIESFTNMCDPYFENSYKYISSLDAIFYKNIKGDIRTQRFINKDFLINFRNMTVDFYVNLQYEQLKSGNITYDYYINNRVEYINSLQKIINNNINNTVTISDSFKYLNQIEKKIFDYESIINLEKANNNRQDLLMTFTYNNSSDEFENIIIDTFDGTQTKNYYNDFNNENTNNFNNKNINDFYFVVEKINNNYQLRLMNKHNPNYSNIDIFTYKYIEDYSNVILEVPVTDYINSLPREVMLGENWSDKNYFTMVRANFFKADDIIEFANNNYNNKKNLN